MSDCINPTRPSEGMDLNPLFTGCTSFRPAATGGELKLFEQAGVKLVHGWLVDPSSPEYRVLSRTEDYDSSVNLLVEADHLTKGQFMVAEDAPTASSSWRAATWWRRAPPSSSSPTPRAPAPRSFSAASTSWRSIETYHFRRVNRRFEDVTELRLVYEDLTTPPYSSGALC